MDSDSEGEEDQVEEVTERSDTEQSISSDSEFESVPIASTEQSQRDYTKQPYFLGKDGETKWYKHAPSKKVRTRAENIIKVLPGSKASVKNLKNPSDLWKYFFDDHLVDIVVTNTNKKIAEIQDRYSRERDAKITNPAEIRALFGLLLFGGVLKSNHLNTQDMWRSDGTGVELFRLTMSETRFKFLLRMLRFDDLTTRAERIQCDKLAAIREVFDHFVQKIQSAYSLSEFVTIDEKLEAFRGRCQFRQYIPSKPNKYGLKIFALCDAKTNYTSNLEVYVGAQPNGPFSQSNSPADVVQRLCNPIKGSSRNITMDNWFTSTDLAAKLLQDFKLTMIGTIRKNKRQLPIEFTKPQGRPVASSMFGFQKHCTLVSYVPKKKTKQFY